MPASRRLDLKFASTADDTLQKHTYTMTELEEDNREIICLSHALEHNSTFAYDVPQGCLDKIHMRNSSERKHAHCQGEVGAEAINNVGVRRKAVLCQGHKGHNQLCPGEDPMAAVQLLQTADLQGHCYR